MLSLKGFKDYLPYYYVMEPVVGIPIDRLLAMYAIRKARQDVLDEVNRILSGHTISSNTEEPDEPIKFCLDDNGDVDIDTT